ncbi:MAG: serine protease [Candidatus Parabeggiatoa sp.]|nr:serine protease [Candidatus Parabeggiatoa sp.]
MKSNFNRCMLLLATVIVTQETVAEPNRPSLASAELNPHPSLRIIGGKDTQEGVWPGIVYIGYTSDPEGKSASCGGSLIHPYWVLTAAHCVDGFKELFNLEETYYKPCKARCEARCVEGFKLDKAHCQAYCEADCETHCVDGMIPPLTGDDMFIVAGLHKRNPTHEQGERLAINRVIQHPRWNPCHPSSHFDIALLQLKEPATQPLITLPLKDNVEIKPNTLATALGWGLIEAKPDGAFPDMLQEVELPIVSNQTCQATYQGEYQILDSMMCAGFKAGKKDTCQNDSGGPLLVFKENQWQQVGIVSFGGHKTEGAARCAGPDAYGVYTRVSTFLDFIAKYVPLPITGAYDGAWTSPALPNTFVMLRNTADTLAVSFLNENGQNWQALLGPLSYPTITVTNFIAPANIILELKPTLTASPPIREISLTTIICRPR